MNDQIKIGSFLFYLHRVDVIYMTDFQKIQEQLSKISLSVESLRLWVEDTIANGKITSEKQ